MIGSDCGDCSSKTMPSDKNIFQLTQSQILGNQLIEMFDNWLRVDIGVQKSLMHSAIFAISLFLEGNLVELEILDPVFEALTAPEGQYHPLFDGVVDGQRLQVRVVVVAEGLQVLKRVRFAKQTVPPFQRF
jgi:hypothetical protein